MKNNNWAHEEGSYVIQEQGDLGLGTQKIDPKYIDKDGNISIPKDDDEPAKKPKSGFSRVSF